MKLEDFIGEMTFPSENIAISMPNVPLANIIKIYHMICYTYILVHMKNTYNCIIP